jgi:hypothetical protein
MMKSFVDRRAVITTPTSLRHTYSIPFGGAHQQMRGHQVEKANKSLLFDYPTRSFESIRTAPRTRAAKQRNETQRKQGMADKNAIHELLR